MKLLIIPLLASFLLIGCGKEVVVMPHEHCQCHHEHHEAKDCCKEVCKECGHKSHEECVAAKCECKECVHCDDSCKN